MKAFFLSRLLREKMLLLGLVAIAAAMWLSAVSTRVRTFWRTASETSTEISVQKRWLEDRVRIQQEATAAASRLDASRTYDIVRLQAELAAIARGTGFIKDYSIDDSQTAPGPQFSINSVRFTIRNVEWTPLTNFYQELSKRAPYIGIEEISLSSSNRANPALLTASLRVSSVEISR